MPLSVPWRVQPSLIGCIPWLWLVVGDSRQLDGCADLFGRLEIFPVGPPVVREQHLCNPGRIGGEKLVSSPLGQERELLDLMIVSDVDPARGCGSLHRQCVTCHPPGGKSWSIGWLLRWILHM